MASWVRTLERGWTSTVPGVADSAALCAPRTPCALAGARPDAPEGRAEDYPYPHFHSGLERLCGATPGWHVRASRPVAQPTGPWLVVRRGHVCAAARSNLTWALLHEPPTATGVLTWRGGDGPSDPRLYRGCWGDRAARASVRSGAARAIARPWSLCSTADVERHGAGMSAVSRETPGPVRGTTRMATGRHNGRDLPEAGEARSFSDGDPAGDGPCDRGWWRGRTPSTPPRGGPAGVRGVPGRTFQTLTWPPWSLARDVMPSLRATRPRCGNGGWVHRRRLRRTGVGEPPGVSSLPAGGRAGQPELGRST